MLRSAYRWLTGSEIRIALLTLLGASALIVPISIASDYYVANWVGDIITEAHGTILDIFIISVVFTAFKRIRRRREKIDSLKREIDDFRHWHAPTAGYRISGNIKRLNEYDVDGFYLYDCYLSETRLDQVNARSSNFKGAALEETNFHDADLTDSFFMWAEMNNAHCVGATLDEARFIEADLSDVKFGCASLKNTLFEGTDLTDASFKNADLTGADLKTAQGLTKSQLSEAETLKDTKLPSNLDEKLREEYSELFE